MALPTDSQVPIIDFTSENLQPGSDKWLSTCRMVRSALESHGCFYALSNKIPMQLHNSVFTLMNEVFDLPVETKRQYTSERPNHGYSERTLKNPLYESVGMEDPSIKEAVQKFTKIMWPDGYDHFCETLNLYGKLLVEMDQIAKRMVYDAYGVDKRHCDSQLESTNYMLRGFKYLVPQKTENNLGLGAHSDSSFFTILHQNNESGLQVKLKNGEWIDIDPSPHMLLFLTGDGFKVWSNDRIDSCKHRVIMKGQKERFSMGLLSYSNHTVQPQEELVDEQHPILYKPFDHYGYIRFRSTSKAECLIKAFCGIDYIDSK